VVKVPLEGRVETSNVLLPVSESRDSRGTLLFANCWNYPCSGV
jgi:hypothetical protein